jgi:hypothetical protein
LLDSLLRSTGRALVLRLLFGRTEGADVVHKR